MSGLPSWASAALFTATAAGITALLKLRKSHTKRGGMPLPGMRNRDRVAIASCRELLEAGDDGNTESYGTTGLDEQYLYDALTARGIPYDVVAWDDAAAVWSSYRAVFVRTTWCYSKNEARAHQFRRWLAHLAGEGIPCFNHSRIISYNVHKQYLVDMSQCTAVGGRGVGTIPTVILRAGTPERHVNLAAIMKANGWKHALLKPCVGGGSRACMRVLGDTPGAVEAGQAFLVRHVVGTPIAASVRRAASTMASLAHHHSMSRHASTGSADVQAEDLPRGGPRAAAAAAGRLADAAAHALSQPEPGSASKPHPVASSPLAHDAAAVPCDMMVQPYIPSVEGGEVSAVVIDGQLTHALHKVPAPGDYRTQEEHGGVPSLITLSPAEVGLVQHALATMLHCVEAVEPPLDVPFSPAHFDTVLPMALPQDALMIARADFLRLDEATYAAAFCEPDPVAAEGHPGVVSAVPRPDPAAHPLLLLEMEVIEPCLFMGLQPSVAEAVADAIERRFHA